LGINLPPAAKISLTCAELHLFDTNAISSFPSQRVTGNSNAQFADSGAEFSLRKRVAQAYAGRKLCRHFVQTRVLTRPADFMNCRSDQQFCEVLPLSPLFTPIVPIVIRYFPAKIRKALRSLSLMKAGFRTNATQ
jgi:hypothetical protein